MTVEDSLERKRSRWRGRLRLSSNPGIRDLDVEVVLPRASAALHIRSQLEQRSGATPTPLDVTAGLNRAAERNDPLPKPFLRYQGDVGRSQAVEFIDAFVELANRGFFSPGRETCAVQRLSRDVINDRGDMRWRLRCSGVAPWAIQGLWIALGWFRREGEPLPEETIEVFVHEVGAEDSGRREQPVVALPEDDSVDLEELLECEAGTLRLILSSEPDDARLEEIYEVLRMWTMVVAPAFPRYGTFIGDVDEPAAIDTRTAVTQELESFGGMDPRALLTIGYWIVHEGKRLGIVGYRFEP